MNSYIDDSVEHALIKRVDRELGDLFQQRVATSLAQVTRSGSLNTMCKQAADSTQCNAGALLINSLRTGKGKTFDWNMFALCRVNDDNLVGIEIVNVSGRRMLKGQDAIISGQLPILVSKHAIGRVFKRHATWSMKQMCEQLRGLIPFYATQNRASSLRGGEFVLVDPNSNRWIITKSEARGRHIHVVKTLYTTDMGDIPELQHFSDIGDAFKT